MNAPQLPIAKVAEQVLEQRIARANHLVSAGTMTIGQVNAYLRPWAAIACLVGGHHPEIDRCLADLAQEIAEARHTASPGQLRAWLADEICPRPRWVPILAAARDAAFDHWSANDDDASLTASRNLQRLCLALQHDVNGHHIPHYTPPDSRQQVAA